MKNYRGKKVTRSNKEEQARFKYCIDVLCYPGTIARLYVFIYKCLSHGLEFGVHSGPSIVKRCNPSDILISQTECIQTPHSHYSQSPIASITSRYYQSYNQLDSV